MELEDRPVGLVRPRHWVKPKAGGKLGKAMVTFMGRSIKHHSHPKFPGKRSRSGKLVESAMHEVFTDEPSTVTRANVSGERKRKMKVAIALSKARKAGARIPYK